MRGLGSSSPSTVDSPGEVPCCPDTRRTLPQSDWRPRSKATKPELMLPCVPARMASFTTAVSSSTGPWRRSARANDKRPGTRTRAAGTRARAITAGDALGNTSAVFVARFIDNNNRPNGDPIDYIGTAVVKSSRRQRCLHRQAVAPRRHPAVRRADLHHPDRTANGGPQTFHGGRVYVTFTEVERHWLEHQGTDHVLAFDNLRADVEHAQGDQRWPSAQSGLEHGDQPAHRRAVRRLAAS